MGFSAARLIQTYKAGLGICSMLQSSSARANLKGCRNKSQYCLRPDVLPGSLQFGAFINRLPCPSSKICARCSRLCSGSNTIYSVKFLNCFMTMQQRLMDRSNVDNSSLYKSNCDWVLDDCSNLTIYSTYVLRLISNRI